MLPLSVLLYTVIIYVACCKMSKVRLWVSAHCTLIIKLDSTMPSRIPIGSREINIVIVCCPMIMYAGESIWHQSDNPMLWQRGKEL